MLRVCLQLPASCARPSAVICQHSCRFSLSSFVSFAKAAMPAFPKLQHDKASQQHRFQTTQGKPTICTQ